MNLRRNTFSALLAVIIICAGFTACHETPDYKDDPLGNFDALSDIVAQRYCFFKEKNIDWNEVSSRYRAKVNQETNPIELFDILSEMLYELQDGHVNLSSYFSTSYYRKWWSDYPQDFDLRTLQEYYLKFNYYQTSGISYVMFVPDSIGYMYYPSFSAGIGETNLDYILALLHKSKGLIIDIRDNGGGMLTNIDRLVGRFISKPTVGGYIRHKTGPGPDDFSEPYEIVYQPADKGRVQYFGPIVVLTNRSCFSAANNFTAVMKGLPDVTIAGARTGGGGGLPFSSEIPNGWSVRFSACPINDRNDKTVEFGIEPDEGCEVHCTAEELAAGIDRILDFGIKYLRGRINQRPDNTKSAFTTPSR